MIFKKIRGCNKGFTLTEITVTLSLLSALAAYSAPNYLSIDKAKAVACLTQKQAIERAGEIYFIDHGEQLKVDFKGLIAEGYLKSVPECQAGGKYYWQQDTRLLKCTIHDR